MTQHKWIRECAQICTGVNRYTINEVQLFVANTTMAFPAGFHSHEEYEFMMPKTQDILTICNDDKISMKKGMFMPFNPFDKHGLENDADINKFVGLSCSKDFFNNLVKKVFKKEKIIFENACFKPSTNLNFLLGVLIDECNNKKPAYEYVQDHLINLIFTEIVRCSHNNIMQSKTKTIAPIERAIKYLEEHYNLPFNLEETAKVSKISKYYFLKMFKLHTGITPKSFLTGIKMEKAKEMIAIGEKNITEIAFELGYSTQSHFCMVFNRYTGITPLDYKKTLI